MWSHMKLRISFLILKYLLRFTTKRQSASCSLCGLYLVRSWIDLEYLYLLVELKKLRIFNSSSNIFLIFKKQILSDKHKIKMQWRIKIRKTNKTAVTSKGMNAGGNHKDPAVVFGSKDLLHLACIFQIF